MWRWGVSGCALAAALAAAGGAWAQSATGDPPPPLGQSTDSNGVDVIGGALKFSATEASVGPSGSAMVRSQLNFTAEDNFYGAINSSGSTYTVSLGGASEAFTQSGSTYTPQQQHGSSLTQTTSNNVTTWIYTTKDGTVAQFNPGWASALPVQANVAQITSLTRPTGEALTYGYTKYPVTIGSPKYITVYDTVLVSVTSNRGLQIKYNWQNNGTTAPTLKSVQGVDLAPGGATGGAYIFSNTVTDPMGLVTNYGAVAPSSTQIITKPSGAQISVTYDANGRVTSYNRGAGTWTYSGWSAGGSSQTVTVTDPAGNKTSYVSNPTTQVLVSVTLPNVGGSTRTTTYAYGNASSTQQVTAITLPHGDSYQYGYDGAGNNTSITHTAAGGGSSYTAYQASYGGSACGLPANITSKPCWTRDANGNETDYTYNAQGLVTDVKSPAVGSNNIRPEVRYSYTSETAALASGSNTPIWLLTGVTSCGKSAMSSSGTCGNGASDQKVVTIAYDTSHNLAVQSVTKAAGDNSVSSAQSFTYDGLGNLASSTSPLNAVSSYTYDADRRITETKAPQPSEGGSLVPAAMEQQYDSKTGLLDYTLYGTDNGSFSQSYYDYYTYDGYDRLSVKRRGPNGQGAATYTQYAYDALSRVQCTAVRMNASTFGSEPVSACTQGTAGSHGPDQITYTTYNPDGTINYTLVGYGSGQQHSVVNHTFNADGTLGINWDGKNNATCYGYDGYGRLTTTYYETPSTSQSCNTGDYDQYGYDNKGEMTSWRKRDGNSYSFAYDALGRMTSGIDGDTYAYDSYGDLISASRSTGGSTSLIFAYDALGRLTAANTSGVSNNISYSYDAAGNRTKLTWPDTNSGGGANYYVTYNRDNLGRLTSILEAGINTADYHQIATYTYDSLGRLYSSTRANVQSSAWLYDGISRLSEVSYGFINSSYNNFLTYQYDEAGQIIYKNNSNSQWDWNPSSGGTSFSYGVNGLNQYTLAGGAAIYYDGKGDLTGDGLGAVYTYNHHNWLTNSNNGASLVYDALGRIASVTSSSGTTTSFLYDGSELIGEYSSSTNALRRYVPGDGVDDFVSWVDNTGLGRQPMVADPQGSILGVTNTAGTPTIINTYDDFGVPGSANSGRIQYTGQIYLSEVGLYNFKARTYSPTLGRFLQTDPTGYADGNNWYNYVHGSPTNGTDPSGKLEAWEDNGGGGGGVPSTPPTGSLFSGADADFLGCSGNCGGENTLYNNTQQAAAVQDALNAADNTLHIGPLDSGAGLQNVNFSITGAVGGLIADGEAAAGTAAAGTAAVIGGILNLGMPSSTADDDTVQYVVRGGLNIPQNFIRGTSLTPLGITGFSASSAPDMSITELTAAGGYQNGQISVSSVQALGSIGIPVIPTPTPGNPYHVTVGAPSPLSLVEASQISGVFRQLPNPLK